MATITNAKGSLTMPKNPPNSAETVQLIVVNDAWQKTLQDMERVRRLKGNWDGEGAVATDAVVLSKTDAVLAFLHQHGAPAPTTLGASRSGAIVLEWHAAEKYVDIEVASIDAIQWLAGESGRLVAQVDQIDDVLLHQLQIL